MREVELDLAELSAHREGFDLKEISPFQVSAQSRGFQYLFIGHPASPGNLSGIDIKALHNGVVQCRWLNLTPPQINNGLIMEMVDCFLDAFGIVV